ncbi:IclR family transcriptional regulator [Nocardioides aromaticivorans]|uniref:IclR family transcriptional regulator n=2 Tax=Nocardioides aromaticivorans TaxID=200618 RepID=A0ABX7PE67_9ACTN|nr:IclR family transcriptional regulator [Nocardioides aromaticivorans]QSR24159.1 IclR family transcriptional regulator [Nocardioides aromaticivorans]
METTVEAPAPPAAPKVTSLRTVDRAFQILSTIAADDGCVTLADLSSRAGVPRPTGLRIARALVGLGALERTSEGYRLGPRIFELGLRAHAHSHLRELALPIMSDLYRWTHGTVHLAVLEGSSTLIVEKIAGPRSMALGSKVGGRGPAHCTGLGKALLANSSVETVGRIVDGGLPRHTSRTITNVPAFRTELSRVRHVGLAQESGESTEGVACVAAPVFDADRQVVAAVSIAGAAEDVHVEKLGPALREAAGVLTRLVSGRR